MSIVEIVTLGGLIISWIISIILVWVKLKLKVEKTDLKLEDLRQDYDKHDDKNNNRENDLTSCINNINIQIESMNKNIEMNKSNLEKHIAWGESMQYANMERFNEITVKSEKTHQLMVDKMDRLIESFADFRVYVESKINK